MELNSSVASNVTKQQHRKAGRNSRATLSCAPCRTRKLKCNREEPCQNCVVRKETQACTYAVSRPKGTSSAAAVAGSRPKHVENMQQRIDRLESLVKNIASQGQPSDCYKFLDTDKPENGSPSRRNEEHQKLLKGPAVNEIGHGIGILSVGENNSQYRGSTYWGDVFQELGEIKSIWGQVQEEYDVLSMQSMHNLHTSFSSAISNGPPLLFSQVKPATFEEILATLPSKPAVDKILERFFDEKDSPMPSFHILHQPTFMREYETHWLNPRATKIMWVGLLFSICSAVMLSYNLVEDEPPEYEGVTERLYELYRLRTTQCLNLGDVTKGAPNTMETLLFYAMGEQTRQTDTGIGVWILYGMIARVALQMGYHRDPSQYPNIPLLQGELRRRVWFLVMRLDAALSFQVGLPSMVRVETHDTAPPRNLFDWELTDNMTELPPSKPKSDITPISYLLAKDNIMKTLGGIVDLLSALGPYSYEKVLQLDDDLTWAQSEIPPYFQMRAAEDSLNDPSALVSKRVQLEVLFHQGMCVLHRKFMAQGRLDGRFEPSRNRCIRSAMALLSIQDLLYREARGQVDEKLRFSRHWYRFSVTSQDFILAAMILCLDLRHRKIAEAANGRPLPGTDYDEKTIIISVLKAYEIWGFAQRTLPDARKVFTVLSHMVEMLGVSPQPDHTATSEIPSSIARPSVESLGVPMGYMNFGIDRGSADEDMNINWAMWDSFVEGASFDDAFGSMLTPPTTDSTANVRSGPNLQMGIDEVNLE
ncbi:hypothetical protein BJ875DRAFT_152352 [Amylocarpus encephaloides]|uniref:Zn(2)-C6 fungal-type domain-containing protein n=1 Tax=Amylocarpus encephaloides TaxID=45428 RepID=A0A9P7YB91_9HELO|nr:hypothetical protein BJ875DRAFT_152352 [Amylocarpus encephaloides]